MIMCRASNDMTSLPLQITIYVRLSQLLQHDLHVFFEL